MSSPANPHESSILGICSICSYEASGNISRPPGGPAKGRVAALPRPPARAWGAPPRGACCPRWLRAPVRSRARAPAYLPTKREGCPGLFWMEIFKKAPQIWGNWRVGKSKICPRGKRQFRARITHAPEGCPHPCGVGGWLGEEKKAGPMHSLSTAFEEINRLARYRVLAPRVVTQNCAA